jgi:hypothetical protein
LFLKKYCLPGFFRFKGIIFQKINPRIGFTVLWPGPIDSAYCGPRYFIKYRSLVFRWRYQINQVKGYLWILIWTRYWRSDDVGGSTADGGGTPRIGSGATDGAHWRPGKMGLECPIFSGVRLKTMRWVWQSPDR